MVESMCTREMNALKDVLKERQGTSDIMYASRELNIHTAYNRHRKPVNPTKFQQEVLKSPILQELIVEMSKEQNISKSKATYVVKNILQEIGFGRQLPIVRWLAYALAKIVKKTLTGIYIAEEKILKIRDQMGKNPVIFVPSHRSYADFILMASAMFHYDIILPCVAAGMDFHSMWLMNNILRDCSAFFMRRSFSDDKVYRTIFTEYVKKLVIDGDAPIEFFIEGTRSRSAKTLPPKFGLLSMVLDPYFSGKVPDITIIPISISYDRTLEEMLFAYEMLGIAKPKESTSGFFKGLKMMDERYGKVYFDFAEPISVKSFVSQLTGGPTDFSVRDSAREQEEILHLGYNIIDKQQKFSVLTCFNVLALVLSNHVSVSTVPLTLAQAIKDVSWLSTVLGVLGALVDVNKDILPVLLEAISVHKSLVRLTPQDEIQLVSVHTPHSKIDPNRLKGHALKGETMYLAVPLLMLQHYVNPCLHYLVGPAMITIIMQHLDDHGHITREELFEKFKFLRNLFSHEFATFKEWDLKDFDAALEKLELLNIVEKEGTLLMLGNHRKLQLILCNLLYPFVSTYLCFGKLLLQTESQIYSEKDLLKITQAKVEEELSKGHMLSYVSLSLDSMSAALASLVAMRGISRIRTNGAVTYKVDATNMSSIIQQLEQMEVQPRMQTDPNELSSRYAIIQNTTSRAKL